VRLREVVRRRISGGGGLGPDRRGGGDEARPGSLGEQRLSVCAWRARDAGLPRTCRRGGRRRRAGPIWASTGQIWAFGAGALASRGGCPEWVTAVAGGLVVLPVVVGGGCSLSGWRRKMVCVSLPCDVSEYCGFAVTSGRRCGDGGAELHGRYCPNSGGVGEARRLGRRSCPVGLVATAPAGVVPLLGGVTEVSRHLPRSLGIGCCLWAKASIQSWIGMMAASSTSYLCWEHRVWRHGLEVLGCFPPVLVVVRG
jgi:hypothetical protein